MSAKADSDKTAYESLNRWRPHEMKQEDTQPDKISAKRRSVYRCGEENDGVKGVSSGGRQNKGS